MTAVMAPRLFAPILETTPSPAATVPAGSSEKKLRQTIPVITPEIAARIESKFCPWMQPREFGQFWRGEANSHLFPLLIEGRLLYENKREYRAIFEKYPVPDFQFFVEYGNQPDVYEEKKTRLLSNGFEILSQQTVEDAIGRILFLTVFVPKSQMAVARECLDRTMH